jgi:hypothetical protein
MPSALSYLDLISRGPAAAGPREGAGALAMRDTGAARTELLDRLGAEIAYVEAKTGADVDRDAVRLLMRQAGSGLDRLFGDGPDADLGAAELSGLEAVVRTDGSRPVLFVEDDFVDVMAPSIGAYAGVLSRVETAVREVAGRSAGWTIPARVRSDTRAPRGWWPKGW